MNKFTYIKISHQEANKEIWDSILVKFKSIKQINCLLAYLWMVFASVAFGFIAIFSWFSFATMFFKDIRFTLHYMLTTIRHSGMDIEEANDYLNSQKQEYNKRLSYGSVSQKEQNRIEKTFEYLYEKYRMPNPIYKDEKHELIASSLVDIKQSVDSISSYAERKDIEEQEEKAQLETLRLQQEQRKTTAHNRSKGRMLTSFESAISEEQLDILIKCCNQIPIFTRDIEKDELKNILLCTHSNPLQADSNRHIAVLFSKLCDEKLICKTWMAVAENQKCFISKNDKLLNSKDLSTANSNSFAIRKDIEKLMDNCIYNILQK